MDFYGFACHTPDCRLCMHAKSTHTTDHRWYTHPCGAASELCHSSDKVYNPLPPSFDHAHCMGAALWHAWDNFESSLQAEHTNCPPSPVQLSASPNATLSPNVFIQHAFLVQALKGTFKSFSSFRCLRTWFWCPKGRHIEVRLVHCWPVANLFNICNVFQTDLYLYLLHGVVSCDHLTAAFSSPVHPLPHTIGPLAKSPTMTGQWTYWYTSWTGPVCISYTVFVIAVVFLSLFLSVFEFCQNDWAKAPLTQVGAAAPKGQLVKHLTIPDCHFCAHTTQEPIMFNILRFDKSNLYDSN